MEDEKKKGEVKVNGGPKFVNGKLILPNPKHKKTAEELLKENPLTGQLKREINAIEQAQQKKSLPVSKKEIKAETMIDKLCKSCEGVTSYFNNYDNVIQYNGKTICWISERKKWVAVSTWGTGGKDWKTVHVATQKDMYDQINILKEKVENVKAGRLESGST